MEMKFERFHMNAIDVKEAWRSTNTKKEVWIIYNTLDQVELWIDKKFRSKYDSWKKAQEAAETKVAFNVKLGEVVA